MIGMRVEGLSAWFGEQQALHDVDLDIAAGRITAILGGTGASKSTLVRVLNDLTAGVRGFRREGRVLLDGVDTRELPVRELRRRVGMVFERPTVFRRSVFDNVAFPLRSAGLGRRDIDARVEQALRDAHLWSELEWRLDVLAPSLPPGLQQRLCVARALALWPDVLILDEPTAALDPLSTGLLEDLVLDLRRQRTVVLVTRDAHQAGRLADVTAFMQDGRVVEAAPTAELFTLPRHPDTEAYLTRRYAHR